MKIIKTNRRARFDYEILDTYEAGIILKGYEVKSVKTGNISLKGSYVRYFKDGFYLVNASIALYKFAGNIESYDPTRSRKLLLTKSEIKHLVGKTKMKGLTLVPTQVYSKRGRIKIEVGVGRGRKKFDKRELIAKREFQRKKERMMRRKR